MGDTDSVTAETIVVDGRAFEVRIGGIYPLEIWSDGTQVAYFSAYDLAYRCPVPRWELSFLAADTNHSSWRLRGEAVDVYRRHVRECDQ